jgi:predicted nucleic acid-binding protein
MGSMIDTMVLVYAFKFEFNREAQSRAQRREQAFAQQSLGPNYEASSLLLRRLSVVRMSAITVVEFCRGMRDDEKAWFDNVSARFDVIATTGAIAGKAADLLRGRSKTIGKVCPKCLSAPEDHVCTKCNLRVASQQRLNDSVIAATAELTTRVSVLYSFDTGVHSFSAQMGKCLIRSPLDIMDAAGVLPEDVESDTIRAPRGTRKKTKPEMPGQSSLMVFFEAKQAQEANLATKAPSVAPAAPPVHAPSSAAPLKKR